MVREALKRQAAAIERGDGSLILEIREKGDPKQAGSPWLLTGNPCC